MSVLTKTLNSKVSFTSDRWFIQELTRELMIGQGSQVGNLYVMDFNEIISLFAYKVCLPLVPFHQFVLVLKLICQLGIIDWVIHLIRNLMFFLMCCVSKLYEMKNRILIFVIYVILQSRNIYLLNPEIIFVLRILNLFTLPHGVLSLFLLLMVIDIS